PPLPLPASPSPSPSPSPAGGNGLFSAVRNAARRLADKVASLLRPRKPSGKEIIINAESLEIRVAVLEHGRLEEFNIERTNEERLVGSIFKG
ncbi:MAG TPA: hypothetical protein PKE47_07720, partial [Verrucomicrobiota bacterium]|nr:hypothetical protein [Verrucomicrobiota bacterium]